MFPFWGLIARIMDVYRSWLDWLLGDGATPDIHSRVRQWRSFTDFSFASNTSTTKPVDLGTRLALRAKANRHLAGALGINNSLTTSDPATHRAFLRHATRRLKSMATPENWQQLYRHCDGVLRQRVSEYHDNDGHLPLAALVRGVCLQSVMHLLFQTTCLDTDDVDTVCNEINRQWVLSKEAQGEDMQQSAALNGALRRLLQHGHEPDTPPQKALELVLPAYEALWRVVLLTYVTVSHRGDGAVRRRLVEADVASVLGTGTAAEKELLNIAKEGLRLFPSSKSIYRANSLSPDDTTTVSTDVCALHRDTEIWGADALEFRPERFDAALQGLQKLAYLPFGLAPHMCPAFNGFGERMILLLVTLMSQRLGPEEASIVFNHAGLDSNTGAQLPSGRYDMQDWVLSLKK